MEWTPSDVISLITALGVIITPLLVVWLNRKVMIKVEEQATNIQKIETATNSMKDALVKATGDEALARGKLEGAAAEKARTPVSSSPTEITGTIEVIEVEPKGKKDA